MYARRRGAVALQNVPDPAAGNLLGLSISGSVMSSLLRRIHQCQQTIVDLLHNRFIAPRPYPAVIARHEPPVRGLRNLYAHTLSRPGRHQHLPTAIIVHPSTPGGPHRLIIRSTEGHYAARVRTVALANPATLDALATPQGRATVHNEIRAKTSRLILGHEAGHLWGCPASLPQPTPTRGAWPRCRRSRTRQVTTGCGNSSVTSPADQVQADRIAEQLTGSARSGGDAAPVLRGSARPAPSASAGGAAVGWL